MDFISIVTMIYMVTVSIRYLHPYNHVFIDSISYRRLSCMAVFAKRDHVAETRERITNRGNRMAIYSIQRVAPARIFFCMAVYSVQKVAPAGIFLCAVMYR